MATEADDPRALIQRALARERASVRALVDQLSPVIERAVASTLWQRSVRRDVRQEVRDMTQAVFLSLFESDGKALRAWDPARGTSLESFVALLAHRQVISLLRNGRTSPWKDEPTEAETLDGPAPAALVPEQVVGSREQLRRLLDAVRENLSPLGLEIFQRLLVDQEPIDEVAVRLGKTMEALYQWRSRLLKLVHELSAKINDPDTSETGGHQRMQGRSSRR